MPKPTDKRGMALRRTKRARDVLFAYIKQEKGLHLCILLGVVMGLLASFVYVCLLPEASAEALKLYMQDFFTNISQSGTDSGELLKTAFFMNGKNFLFLLLCALMVIGAPLVFLFCALCCFMHGFTLFYLFRIYSFRAALFFLLGMCPHYLLQIPVYWVSCLLCLRFSLGLSQDKYDLKKRTFSLMGKLIGLFCLSMMAALLQAYAEPFLIGLIAELYR